MNILANNYSDYFLHASFFDDSDYKALYSVIERKISSFFIFTILTSIQTGKNWFSAFDNNIMLKDILTAIGTDVLRNEKDEIFEKLTNNVETMDLDEFFENTEKEFTRKNIQEKISKMYELLQKNILMK